METVMIHSNGVNTQTVAPHKVKRLTDMGWRIKTDVPAEVIKFQEENEIQKFLKEKQAELYSGMAGGITNDVANTPPPPPPPPPPPDYSMMTKNELIDKAIIKGGVEKELKKLNKAKLIEFIQP